MAKQEFKLEQTKSTFKVAGKVTRIGHEKAYRQGSVQNGRFAGNEYRSVRFGIQTSQENEINVELFGMELDFVYPYSMKAKKSQKIPFSQRHNTPEGFHIIGVNVNLERDAEGKPVRKSFVEFDAVDEIYNGLEDGDSVFVNGKLEYSTYKNQADQEIEQTKYIITSITKMKNDIDFDAENFEEIAQFEQELVIVDTFPNEEKTKLVVLGRTIAYADKYQDATFTIDAQELPKLAKNFNKLGFGDFIKVYGDCVNRVEFAEVEVEEESGNDWGGRGKPKAFENNAVKNYITELRIVDVDGNSFVKGKYTEDDFFKEELVEDAKDIKDNPFVNSDEDEDDDDLPF